MCGKCNGNDYIRMPDGSVRNCPACVVPEKNPPHGKDPRTKG